MYKEDLALNNLQWLICHKTKTNPHHHKYPGYDSKLSDSKVPVLEPLVMLSTPSMPLLFGQLWPTFVVPIRVSSMGQIQLLNRIVSVR